MKIRGWVWRAAIRRGRGCSARSRISPITRSSKSKRASKAGARVRNGLTNKNVDPKKVVNLGDEVEVMVLEIDEDRRRISLGMKQCKPNPWEDFAQQHKKGDKVGGAIKSITDFGVFIGLPGGIDGLVHLSDLSWSEPGEEAVRRYKKGDEIEAMVLAIDTERERISLGVKQMSGDPFTNFAAGHEKGAMVEGTVKSVDAKGAVIDLAATSKLSARIGNLSRSRRRRAQSSEGR